MPAVDARDADVVIVGAGVAGLTAAWRLASAELRVVVLEARDRVGGRLHTVELEGEPFELGGQWIAPTQSAVRALLEELGLELFPRHRAGDSVRLMADGRVVRAGGDDLGLAPDGVAAYEAGGGRLVGDWRTHARLLDVFALVDLLERGAPGTPVFDAVLALARARAARGEA